MQEFKLPKIFNWEKASEKIVKKKAAVSQEEQVKSPVEGKA